MKEKWNMQKKKMIDTLPRFITMFKDSDIYSCRISWLVWFCRAKKKILSISEKFKIEMKEKNRTENE